MVENNEKIEKKSLDLSKFLNLKVKKSEIPTKPIEIMKKESKDDEESSFSKTDEDAPILIINQKKDFTEYLSKLTLADEQTEAIKVLRNGDLKVLVVLPTGLGKTIVAEELANQCVKQGKKFIIASPLKALAQEQSETFGNFWNILILSGDYQKNKKLVNDNRVQGYCMTYEMLYQYLAVRDNHAFFNQIGAIIIDEAHIMADSSRGFKVESTIYLKDQLFPNIRLLLLSATIGNYQEMAKHFNSKLIYAGNDKRPIPLQVEVIDYPQVFYAKEREEQANRNVDFLIAQCSKGKQFLPLLIFVNARKLCNTIMDYINVNYPKLRVRIHNAGERTEDRIEVENLMRNGDLDVVICTTTLSMGLNVPCCVVGTLGITFWNQMLSKETLMSFSQMIQINGRSGRRDAKARYGIDCGYAYVFSDSRYLKHCGETLDNIVRENVQKPMEVQSRIIPLNPTDYLNGGIIEDRSYLNSTLLGWISAGLNQKAKLQEMYHGIFRLSENITDELYTKAINYLLKYEFIADAGNSYRILDLGMKVVRKSILPETAVHFYNMAKVLQDVDETNINYNNLWVLINSADEFCGNIGVAKKSKEDQLAIQIAEQFISVHEIKEMIKDNAYFDELIEAHMDQLKKGFGMMYNQFLTEFFNSPKMKFVGDMYTLTSSASRIIDSCNAILGENAKHIRAINNINEGVKVKKRILGKDEKYPIIHKEILELMELKGLGFKKAITLYNADITSIDDLREADLELLAQKTKQLRESNKNKYISMSKDVLEKIITTN